MARDLVYFDLETQRTANDVGGWHNKHEMGISVAVTFSTKLGRIPHLHRGHGEQTSSASSAAPTSSSDSTTCSFDYAVLRGCVVLEFTDQLENLDLMLDLEKKIGHRPKLDAVASATLGAGKTADGLEAIRWWQQAHAGPGKRRQENLGRPHRRHRALLLP